MRYKFYREHKCLSAMLGDVERLMACTDFRDEKQVEEAREAFEGVVGLLTSHAEYEDERLHPLLSAKGSTAHEASQEDHDEMEGRVEGMRELFERVRESDAEGQIAIGDEIYRFYRSFYAGTLLHFDEEEREILPELQRLYTDEELRAVEGVTYEQMAPEEMVEMTEILFPHMNRDDCDHFLRDMQLCEPEKFAASGLLSVELGV